MFRIINSFKAAAFRLSWTIYWCAVRVASVLCGYYETRFVKKAIACSETKVNVARWTGALVRYGQSLRRAL